MWWTSPFPGRRCRARLPPRTQAITRSQLPESLRGVGPTRRSRMFFLKEDYMLNGLKFARMALLVASFFLYAVSVQAQEPAPKLLAAGEFHKVEKTGKGTAAVYELADGKRILRLSNFES